MLRRITGTLGVLLVMGIFAGLAIAQDAQVEVTEILMGTELESGVPTSPSTSFSRSDGRIYCMVRLTNASREAGAVRISFEPAEGPRGQRFEYPARPRYRTVARTGTRRDAGAYRCVVRTDEGAVLSHQDFQLSE